MPPKKQSAASKKPIRINWIFRHTADPDPLADPEIEATILYGHLIDCCDAFAFQLESAPNTGYLHFQGYFALTNKKRFDWIQKNVTHFTYLDQMRGKPHQAWAYATKQETRQAGPWTWGECPENGKAKDTTYQDALAAPTVRDGLRIIKENRPRDFCLYGSAIQRNLETAHIQPFTRKYELTDFNHAPMDFTRTTHLYGPSNTGKTSFVKAHFNNPLVVSHMDTLKKLSVDHDAIIFDDMSFFHLHPEAVIHLVDQDDDRDIHIRYSTAHIPANTKKVFTHNTRDIFYKAETNDDQKFAIDRRVQYCHVPAKLFAVPAILLPEDYADHSVQEAEED